MIVPFNIKYLQIHLILFEIAHEYIPSLYTYLANTFLVRFKDLDVRARNGHATLVEGDVGELLVGHCCRLRKPIYRRNRHIK